MRANHDGFAPAWTGCSQCSDNVADSATVARKKFLVPDGRALNGSRPWTKVLIDELCNPVESPGKEQGTHLLASHAQNGDAEIVCIRCARKRAVASFVLPVRGVGHDEQSNGAARP